MNDQPRNRPIPRGPLAFAAASAVVIGSVGIPSIAHAAEPLSDDTFYASSASGSPSIYAVDPDTGALTDAGIGGPGAVNQVGVSRDGSFLVATDTTRVHRYTAATGTWDSVARSTGPTVPNTHGAVDPLTGHLFYGGLSGSTLQIADYDPATNTIASTAISITVPGAPGGNGDLAFDGEGNMYVVLGSAATSGSSAYSRLYRVDRASIASGTGTATQLGGNIAATALNSIAFGKDGYLYVAGGLNAQSDYIQIDPATGATVDRITLSTRVTDLASIPVPRTISIGVDGSGLVDGDDSFTVVIRDSDDVELLSDETDAEGDAGVGPGLVVPEREYEISLEPGDTTNPDDYDTTWVCTDEDGETIAEGVGTSGSFTYPGAAEAIDCTFITVPRALPAAVNDEDLRNMQGSTVTVAVVGNDTGDALDPSSVRILDGDDLVTELVVDGEGTWTVDAETGAITFVPEAGFTGNPTPITYEVRDDRGNAAQAAVVITYLPIAADDEDLDNASGTDVTVPVVSNDTGELDPASVRIIDPTTGEPVIELVVAGEGTWTVDPETGDITFSPEDGFVNNPTPITYSVTDAEGEKAEAEVVVTYVAAATDDVSSGNEPGTAVVVPITGNDSEDLDPSTVGIIDPETGEPVSELVVDGEGTWTVDPETGDITFTPEDGFDGNPTPITYTGEDGDGNPVEATVTVTYLPTAHDDEDLGNEIGSTVTVPVADNDSANVAPSTVAIVDPATGEPVSELVVDGEGTWTVDPETGDIAFTPEDGFESSPTPIEYVIEDADGNETTATVTVGYAPLAQDDEDLANEPGTAVTVPVAGNDLGDVDPSTVAIIDPATDEPVTELVVDGEGTWTVDPETGDITFTPEEGFDGNPTPIDYTIADASGQASEATVTVTYLPAAAADEDLDNVIGTPVIVDVVGNDSANVDPSTVAIIDPATGEPVTELVVDGEGTWTVDPETGAITFTPEPGFIGDPTVIDYTVSDAAGNPTGATVTVTYVSDPADDENLGNTIGEPVTVPVVSNDPEGLDPETVKLIDPETGDAVTEVVVPGEGTWTVNPETGDITFTPEGGFEGNPTPVDYVFAPEGQPQSEPATVTVGYQPVAADDSDLDNAPGSTVVVSVIDNDRGDLVPSTVKIIDPETGEAVTELVVPGEGTWTVNPETGEITFTPESGFTGNPTPIEYSVQDVAGVTTTATVTVTYQGAVAGGNNPGDGLATTGGQLPWGLAGLGALLLGLAGAALAFARRRLNREA
ncbi:Ig-like domain-containing protein [Microbacterium sp. NPDC055903]